jgi:hypothetical protein
MMQQRLAVTDPMVDSLSYVLAELDEWEHDEERSQETFRAPISADIYHKANISGGAEYAIALPDARADAPLENVMILLPGPPVPAVCLNASRRKGRS